MYQKLIIREADAHVCARLEQKTIAKESVDTRVSVIRPDRMIIYSDWDVTILDNSEIWHHSWV
jgi:hypothetical protein